MADDESWLYGDDNEAGGEGEDEEDEDESQEGQQEVQEDQEHMEEAPDMDQNNGTEITAEEDENEDGSDDSDDDDGIKVTINQEQIEAAKTNYQSMQLKKNNVTDIGFAPSHKEKKGKFAVEDFDSIGTINGQPSIEVDLESLEEKPWRKPGADITDYFNYGFTEDTWGAYGNRQRRMRVNESGVGLTGNSAILSQNRLTGALSGTIPTLGGVGVGVSNIITLGGGDQNIRKVMTSAPPPTAKKELEPSGITVMTHEKRVYSTKVMGTMDFSMPPPGFDPGLPPPGGPPPDAGPVPPPMGEFPPSDPFGEYSEGDPFQGGYEPTASAQWSVPPPAGTWSNEGAPPEGHEQSYGTSDRYSRRRDSRDERYRDRDHERDRGSSSRSRRRSRSRSRDRGGERDRERRDRDRDRDRDDREKKIKKEKKSRSRSRERDRSRSPRHKKSKKDKKDKGDRDSPSRSDKTGDPSKENKEDPPNNSTPAKVKEEPKDKE